MNSPDASAQSYGELSDSDVGHALQIGSVVGILAIYVIVALISATAGASWTEALVIAVAPAIVGGPFFGALVVLGDPVRTTEHRPRSSRSSSGT